MPCAPHPARSESGQEPAATHAPESAFNTADVITELGVGEALVSFLDEKGRPAPVERSL